MCARHSATVAVVYEQCGESGRARRGVRAAAGWVLAAWPGTDHLPRTRSAEAQIEAVSPQRLDFRARSVVTDADDLRQGREFRSCTEGGGCGQRLHIMGDPCARLDSVGPGDRGVEGVWKGGRGGTKETKGRRGGRPPTGIFAEWISLMSACMPPRSPDDMPSTSSITSAMREAGWSAGAPEAKPAMETLLNMSLADVLWGNGVGEKKMGG